MRYRLVIFTTIFVSIYTLYLKTMPSTVYWQDSGVFLAGVKTLGVIFPPGFPLYILFGWLWVKLISILPFIPLNFPQKVHAFSGLWGAGAAALTGVSVYEIISHLEKGNHPSRLKIPISVISGLSAGVSYSLWSQSINAEIYSMIGFFAALIFFTVVKILNNWPKPPLGLLDFSNSQGKWRKYLLLLALVWGLSFGSHLLTVTFFIPILWLSFALRFFPFIKVRIGETYKPLLTLKTWLLIILIFSFSAVIPYLYLPIRSAQNPAVHWAKIDSPKAFLNHVSGASYRGSEGAIQPPNLAKLKSYPVLFFQEFFFFGTLLGLLGLWVLYRERRPEKRNLRHFALLGAFFAVAIYALISFYERGTEYNYWLITFYLYWNILIGLGLWFITQKITLKPLKALVFLLLTLGLLGPQIWINWPILNRSSYTLAQEFGENLIGKLPPNSVFFTMGDQESAIPLYLQKVIGYRIDITIVSDSLFTQGENRAGLSKIRTNLRVPSAQNEAGPASPEEITDYINEFIRDNIDKNLFVITKNYLPLSPEFQLIPSGTIWKIVKAGEGPELIDLSFWNYQFSDTDRYRKPERLELSRKKTDFKNGQPIISYVRAPYSDEAKIFELQGKKNLGDLCFAKFEEKGTLRVKLPNGTHEDWQKEKLAQCAQESYEAMLKIDPDFYHRDVLSKLVQLYRLSQRNEEAKKLLEKIKSQENN